MQMLLADSCFNITHESFKGDLDDIIKKAIEQDVGYYFCPSSKENEIKDILDLSSDYKNRIICSVGIHPHNASELKPDTIKNLEPFLDNEQVKSVGEIGLDYFRNFQSPEIQIKCFIAFLQLAANKKYPVFLHHREAFEDFYPILKDYIDNIPQSIVHCFTGSKYELKKFLDLGLFIGITGWICDPKRGANLKELIKYIPPDRLIIETDAPYLVPKNLKIKPKNNRNEPYYLPHILEEISLHIGRDKEKIALETTSNFKKLFRI